MIDVMFYKKKDGFLDKIICWWTRSEFSHVEFLLQDNQNGTAVVASSSPLDGGVRIRTIQYNESDWVFVRTHGDYEKIKTWFEENKGRKYDWAGALGFAGPFSEDKEKWFCSEVIAYLLGLEEPWRFNPGSLYAVLITHFDPS